MPLLCSSDDSTHAFIANGFMAVAPMRAIRTDSPDNHGATRATAPSGCADMIGRLSLSLCVLLAGCAAAPTYTMSWHDNNGEPVEVLVLPATSCPNHHHLQSCMQAVSGRPIIYLANNKRTLPHELAHVAGMRHTQWKSAGYLQCARVTEAGRATGYEVGDLICGGLDGSDIRERI